MTPEEAYYKALDEGPSDTTRIIACQDAYWAYMYALNVDKCPRDDTRAGACRVAGFAYLYARNVDKGSRDDTREAASRDWYWEARYESSFPVNRS